MKTPIVVPTITAYDTHAYRDQVNRVSGFAKRLHVDLMDGHFAPTVSPPLVSSWWPKGVKADLHLMYNHVAQHIETLVALKPNLVILHAELSEHSKLPDIIEELTKFGINVGMALLAETPVARTKDYLKDLQHVLIFSGKLGYHGGKADLHLCKKVRELKALKPNLEIGWDGGIDADNAKLLVQNGVDVLNVGGFIQKADDPEANYQKLVSLVQS